MAISPNPAKMIQKWQGASANVVQAVQTASQRTGVSFNYLMNKAKQESSFNPSAKAGTSSATGLYQFIDSTWLHAIKEYGEGLGLGKIADNISMDNKGRPQVLDMQIKQQILKLRENPEIAATITAEMTKDNASHLENSLGTSVGESDLYLAHFLGLGGAEKFLKTRQDNPSQAAADIFPAAASANRNIFFDKNGQKRSVNDVYDLFAKKMDATPDGGPVIAMAETRKTENIAHKIAGQEANHNSIINALGIVSDIATQGQRQLLESLLAGVNNFGGARNDSSLLSPYTSLVLAKLQSPDENALHGDQNRKT